MGLCRLQQEKPYDVFDTMSVYLLRAENGTWLQSFYIKYVLLFILIPPWLAESTKKISFFKKSLEVAHVDFSKPTEGTIFPPPASRIDHSINPFHCVVVLTADDVQPGRYIIVPCTFSPAQEASFTLYNLSQISTSGLTALEQPFFLEAKVLSFGSI